MIKISGYTEIAYKELQEVLAKALEASQLTNLQIAEGMGVTTSASVYNGFKGGIQILSDSKMSKLFEILKISACILYCDGNKNYLISNKTKHFKKSK